jgi:hypothetical protein
MAQQMLCGIVTMTLDKTTLPSYCWSNTVTLKVTDVNGNSATETAIVVEDKLRQ